MPFVLLSYLPANCYFHKACQLYKCGFKFSIPIINPIPIISPIHIINPIWITSPIHIINPISVSFESHHLSMD
ncbi:hypothetical protein PGT21_023281 [Puccinia graminis f. sp. tritici]|uniref:Uncharacterized protein n=1 Tax=Puccinia graminis f. sp. tritici TaxID=56615 RepID=A0A5B0QB96_PUCGR|nr:hypothetical protein PGT21_023281 [Puccinia graminis f. sp. tritici]